MGKKNSNIKDIRDKAKRLEDMLTDMDDFQAAIEDGSMIPKIKALEPLNYATIKEDCDEKADNIIDSVVLMYLPEELVEQHSYISQKMIIDRITVSNLLFQMITAEHAIKKLLEELDNGNTTSRNFEVLSSLQRSKMEIVKHLTAFMVTMETNYKNIKFDYLGNTIENDNLLPEKTTELEEVDSEAIKFRGTRDLMSVVQNYLENEKE